MSRSRAEQSDREANGMAVFGGTASSELTDRICAYLKVRRAKATISAFPDRATLLKTAADSRATA